MGRGILYSNEFGQNILKWFGYMVGIDEEDYQRNIKSGYRLEQLEG